jgi:hypothetical protein
MLIVGLSVAWAADCERRLSTAELDGLLGDARRSLEKLDTELFVKTTDALDLAIPCLGEPLTRHLAAEIHRTKGIRAVSERDPEAPLVFAAARTIEPAYKFPSTLIPEGNPVRLAYAEVDTSKGRWRRFRRRPRARSRSTADRTAGARSTGRRSRSTSDRTARSCGRRTSVRAWTCLPTRRARKCRRRR